LHALVEQWLYSLQLPSVVSHSSLLELYSILDTDSDGTVSEQDLYLFIVKQLNENVSKDLTADFKYVKKKEGTFERAPTFAGQSRIQSAERQKVIEQFERTRESVSHVQSVVEAKDSLLSMHPTEAASELRHIEYESGNEHNYT